MAFYRKCVCACMIKVKDFPWYSTKPFWAQILLLPSALILHITCNQNYLRVLYSILVASRQEPHDILYLSL